MTPRPCQTIGEAVARKSGKIPDAASLIIADKGLQQVEEFVYEQ
jgi:hypothetical protein